MQIIFGTKRLGKVDNGSSASEKYPDQAVITLEREQGKGKSRRFLFNRAAMEAFRMENGTVNEVVFGTLIDNNDTKSVLIANADDLITTEGLTIYKTSKNAVYYNDSREKGKAISSKVITGDINDFLDLDNSIDHEFTIKDLNNDQIEAQLLVPMASEDSQNAHVGETHELQAEVPGEDPFAVNEAPEQPSVEANWEEDIQESQVDTGLTRATVE